VRPGGGEPSNDSVSFGDLIIDGVTELGERIVELLDELLQGVEPLDAARPGGVTVLVAHEVRAVHIPDGVKTTLGPDLVKGGADFDQGREPPGVTCTLVAEQWRSKMLRRRRRATTDARVDEGRVVTSAGTSAGIDMSLHLVRRREYAQLARATTHHMDHEWRTIP
jgi:hypothetical protein